MKAVIMAGGEGSRLRPLTCDLPKPMVPIMDRPVMEYAINLLKSNGIRDIAATLQYLPDEIIRYFGDGSAFGVNMQYYIEDTPLGTAGSVKNCGAFLDDTFIVISGDALCDIDIGKAIEFHRSSGSLATLVLKRVEKPMEFGVVITGSDGRIERFLEKPSRGEIFSDTVNTGIYILEAETMENVPTGKYDFSMQLFPKLFDKGAKMFGYLTDGYWCDIGNSSQYIQAHFDIFSGKCKTPLPHASKLNGIFLEHGADGGEATVMAPCYIGKDSVLNRGCFIGPYSVVGKNCRMESGAKIKRGILWPGVSLGKDTQIRSSVLCKNSAVLSGGMVFEEAIIGTHSIVGESCVVKPRVKVWPEKRLEDFSTARCNIVWGGMDEGTLFGQDCIIGEINIGLNAETACIIGAAFASCLETASNTAIASDGSAASNMVIQAISAGLMGQGTNIYDLQKATLPMVRYGIQVLGLDAGVYVSGGSCCKIYFMDKNGIDIPRKMKKSIEAKVERRDMPRAAGDEIGISKFSSSMFPLYISGINKRYDTSVICGKTSSVLVASASELALRSINGILSTAGCELHATRWRNSEDFMRNLRKLGIPIGIVVSADGQNATLYTQNGVVDEHKKAALINLIALKTFESSSIITPVSSPDIFDDLAKSYGGKNIRVKQSKEDIMHAIRNLEDKDLMNWLLDAHFDGAAFALLLMIALCKWNTNIDELLGELPDFHMHAADVECSFNDIGRVLRGLISGSNKPDLFEGVRIDHGRGWTLILPDREKPVFRVLSQGFSEEYAKELTDIYIKNIEELKKGPIEDV